ncbi:hypothetical protein FRC05_006851 [Tulasnella sp. 425]|nr:hypothetical protein FRC05_006851 [Tulasnella sp. 425]
MLDFRSYKVSIRVNGQDLPIYQPEYDQDTKTATCWIALDEGQCYTVFYQQDETFRYTTSTRVYLDGNKAEVARALMGKGRNYSGCLDGGRVTETSRCPFEFASLRTTDDDAYLGQSFGVNAPGTIRVQMYRVRVTGDSSWEPCSVPEATSIVHEKKSKKAGGHVTRLGRQEALVQVPRYYTSKPYHASDIDPWVSFEFRYRPAAILQAEGIMPKPQVNDNHGYDYDDEEMGLKHKAEILALEAEQAALDARRTALRAKLGNFDIKREASPIRVPRNAVVGVIDLTLEYVRIYSSGASTD